jgi:alpha-mannosidase
MYEYCNRRVNVKVSLFTDINYVYETDLMENALQEVVPNGDSFDVEIKPFEIKTFKIRLKSNK